MYRISARNSEQATSIARRYPAAFPQTILNFKNSIMSTHQSVVKWFDAKRGYGFIVNPDGGADIFVHYSSIQSEERFKTLRKEQGVTFDLEEGSKGLHAVNVIPDEQEDYEEYSSWEEDDAPAEEAEEEYPEEPY